MTLKGIAGEEFAVRDANGQRIRVIFQTPLGSAEPQNMALVRTLTLLQSYSLSSGYTREQLQLDGLHSGGSFE